MIDDLIAQLYWTTDAYKDRADALAKAHVVHTEEKSSASRKKLQEAVRDVVKAETDKNRALSALVSFIESSHLEEV